MKKKILVFLLFFLGMMVFAPSIQAQKKSKVTSKTVKVNGTEYYKHYVTSGETLYGLSIAYKVSIDEIIRLNPIVEQKGLQAEQNLIIPIKVKPKQEQKPKPKPVPKPKVDSVQAPKEEPKLEPKAEPKVEQEPKAEPKKTEESKNEPITEPVVAAETVSNPAQSHAIIKENMPKIKFDGKDYYLHEVKTGQTVEEIAEAYEMSVEQLMHYNPGLKQGLKIGEVLSIPVSIEHVSQKEPIAEQEIEPKQDAELIVESNEPVEATVVEPEVQPEETVAVSTEQPEPKAEEVWGGGMYTVQAKEDLYDIAKRFGIDIADFKAINVGLKNSPKRGTVIEIPKIINENDYIVHRCEKNERVSSLLKRWKVDEKAFRAKNISVGSHVFVSQVVLIPIEPITDFYWIYEPPGLVEEDEPVETHSDANIDFEAEMGDIPVCVADPENAERRYNVALMVPLFLQDIDNLEMSKEKTAKSQKSRSMSFLQYYEGFVMAAEALEKQGLKLNLTVIDVTDNVSSAEKALKQIRGKDLDLIVGPFFGKAFTVVEEYAKANGIPVVNPLSTRESVIADNPNVVKVKPGDMGLILSISNLVKNTYSDANVFIVSRENSADTAFLSKLKHHLNLAIHEEVTVSGDEFLHFARNESERMEMGARLVSTIDVEGQVYSTEDFKNGVTDKVVIHNAVKRYGYDDINKVVSQLSGVRDNLIVAYGDDNVFATEILNTLSLEADRFPITLVCAPDWARFEKLLVDNLLKMNAIYVSDYFVDYQSDATKQFVLRFRNKYLCEPQKYAFEGYDLGYYFLSALMQYGSDDLLGCLHCYKTPMLHTTYRFYYKNYLNTGSNYGKENLNWNLYQFDNELIKLTPLDAYKKNE